MSRREARHVAVEVLYAADIRDTDPEELLAERAAAPPYAAVLVCGVHGRLRDLDAALTELSGSWRPERMSVVDRNILRVALWELWSEEVPPAVVVDEAVELAKHISGDESGRFVNGVLGAELRRRQAGGSSSG